MNVFVIIYYTLLLGGSCLAAFYNKRSAFLLLFSLTLISFILGIVGGVGALRIVATCAGLLALSAMVSYAFREFLVAIAPTNLAKELRTAPRRSTHWRTNSSTWSAPTPHRSRLGSTGRSRLRRWPLLPPPPPQKRCR